jgi:aspartate aminotransferase
VKDNTDMPQLSHHFNQRSPSAIRTAQIMYAQRADKNELRVLNLGIGNISLPMHPAMKFRMQNVTSPGSDFQLGVARYSPSVGEEECRDAFLNVIASAGAPKDDLYCMVTDGGSMSMEIMLLGVCGPQSKRPIMLFDPVYTNYLDMARRIAAPTFSIRRDLGQDGTYSFPSVEECDNMITEKDPTALLVIPVDNPTGQYLRQEQLIDLAKLCVKHDLWLVSDEAYRQLHYTGDEDPSTIWRINEEQVPGITGRRISIESASKVWNACGLRVGALVTDNKEFHTKAVAEHTANLSSNVLGQYIFGALAYTKHDSLKLWYEKQRKHYSKLMGDVRNHLLESLPGLIVSKPEASVYAVLDVREIAPPDFDAADFVAFCAQEGRVQLEDHVFTLLCAPMAGFYGEHTENDRSRFQMRLAFVEPANMMAFVAPVFAELFRNYTGQSK